MGTEWHQTKLGQEAAEAIKSMARSLREIVQEDKAEKSTLISTPDVFFKQRVAERAWELFKQEVDKAELIEAPGGAPGVDIERVKHYVSKAYQLANLFTAYVDGK